MVAVKRVATVLGQLQGRDRKGVLKQMQLSLGASQVALVVKNLLASAGDRLRFDPWIGKISWRRKWQPTPVLLPGKSHGQNEPGELQSMGVTKELYSSERLNNNNRVSLTLQEGAQNPSIRPLTSITLLCLGCF